MCAIENAGQTERPKTIGLEKNWTECGIEEKIERLHHVLKVQGRQIHRLQNENYALERLVKFHSHDQKNGDLLVPARMISAGVEVADQASPDEGRFF